MDIGVFRPLSVVLPVAAMPLCLDAKGAVTGAALAAAALLTAASAAAACLFARAGGTQARDFLPGKAPQGFSGK